jgi:RNA polymerase sigma-70 factor (ECF subfamily)
VDFRAIFDGHLTYVWNTLRRLGVPERDREDLANEVFLVVHRKLASYDAGRPLRPWLFGIAHRCASDYRRLHRHRYELQIEFDEPASMASSAHSELEAQEAKMLLAAALEKVDYDRRAVLILHDLDGCSMPDIASALGIPVRTGYSRLRIGREELAAAVRRIEARRSR